MLSYFSFIFGFVNVFFLLGNVKNIFKIKNRYLVRERENERGK